MSRLQLKLMLAATIGVFAFATPSFAGETCDTCPGSSPDCDWIGCVQEGENDECVLCTYDCELEGTCYFAKCPNENPMQWCGPS